MTTTNKGLEEPATNATNWDVPLNTNFGRIDAAFGGETSKNVTGVGVSPVTLSAAEYRNLILTFSGTLSNNVEYLIPTGIGGHWLANNQATGAFTLTISSGGGGSSVVIEAGAQVSIYSDGTNILTGSSFSAGSNETVLYNSGGSLTGSTGFTYNGSKVVVTPSSASTATPVEALRLDAQSTGTPAAGFGPMIAMAAETTPGVTKVGAEIAAAIADTTGGSEDFDLVLSLMTAGAAAAEQARITSTGVIIPRVALWATDLYGKTGASDAKVNGITVALASQAEAQAGTNNTKLMTPLRVAEAISALTTNQSIYLLGTLTTTSGTSQTLSSLVLTDYKFLRLSIEGVSLNGITGSPFLRFGTNSARQITAALASASNQWRGQVVIDLATGMYVADTAQENSTDSAAAASYAGYSGITTASTSLTISSSQNSYDLGSIKVYGEK